MAKKDDLIKLKIGLFKSRLQETGYDDVKTILFGSWAKGVAHEWSDIDVCVVSKKIKNRYDERILFKHMANEIDGTISPVAMRPEDLEDKYFTLAQEVKKYGVVV